MKKFRQVEIYLLILLQIALIIASNICQDWTQNDLRKSGMP